jgi:purine nucleosidase
VESIWLDTDIGNDPDDCLAVAYLAAQRECRLVGISTVGKEPETRARLAELVVREMGVAVPPVCAGAGRPIYPTPYWDDHHLYQAPLLEQWPVDTVNSASGAVGSLAAALEARPGEITVMAVGPLTNIAGLALYFPEAARKAKRLVVMGGRLPAAVDRPKPDCNIMLDSIASAAVFSFEWPRLTVLGLGIEQARPFPEALLRERLTAIRHRPLLRAAETSFRARGHNRVGTSDPMTAVLPFAPELYTLTTASIGIELVDRLNSDAPLPPGSVLGALCMKTGPSSARAELVESIDFEAFERHFFDVVAGEERSATSRRN